jgi:hypothetical protein
MKAALQAVLSKPWTLALGAGLGVFAGFVHAFHLGAPYPALLQTLALILAGYGVNVITGSAFVNLLHVPQALLALISLVLATVSLTAPLYGMAPFWLGVVQGGIAFLLSLGFGTSVSPAAAARSQSRAVRVIA